MGPTGSDVGRGTAAGYVNMQTKTPHLPASARATLTVRHRRPAPHDPRRQPAALRRRSRQLDWQVGRPPERAVAGQRRRRPRRSRERDEGVRAVAWPGPGHADPRHRLGADPASGQSARLRHSRAPPGRRSLLAPTTVHADQAGRSEQLLRQPGVRLRPRRPEHRHRRASSTICAPRWTVSNQTRYNRTEREAIISTVQSVDLVRAGDRPGDDRASGQRPREPDHVEPDGPLRARHDRPHGAQHQLRPRVRPRSAVRADAGRRRHPRAGQHLQPEPERSDHRLRADRGTGAFTDGQTNTAAIYAFDSVSLGTRAAGERRPALRALRHQLPLGRCGRASRRWTSRAPTGW